MTRGARAYTGGVASGTAIVLRAPLSLWGGLDSDTGNVIDRSHPDVGICLTGRVLVMEGGRGSSSSSAVLAEALRRGTAPAAFVLATPDPILTVGALVAEQLYGTVCPIVVCDTGGLVSGARISITAADGRTATVEVLG